MTSYSPRLISQLVKGALSKTRARHSSHKATLSAANSENKDIAKVLQKQTILSASLFVKDKAYINGRWVESKTGATFEVRNPSNGRQVTTVPHMNAEDTLDAVNAAYKAFQTWKSTTAKERSDLLKEAYKLMLENKEELAYLITTENGKPLTDSLAEVDYSSRFCEWFAEEARRIQGSIVSSPFKDKKIFTLKQPVGVCGMITPWNFPNIMITRKACAALAAGCSIVVKPSEDTPLSALALCEVFRRAGFPPGVFNVITCDKTNAAEVGKILCGSPLVSHISFTGSSPVGKNLLKQSANTIKKCSMELGGNAPFIVFDSADIDVAVSGAMSSKFRNTGQKMKTAMKKLLITADGFTIGATQGPLINSSAVEKVDDFVQDAVDKGARVVLGGKRSELGGNFYESTLIKDVSTDMRVFREEIFGPVVAVQKFQTEDEVIELAHQTRAGLASYVYTQDPIQQWRMAEALEYGIVGINEGLFTAVEAPFGGYKESGLGREGGIGYGIEEYLEVKYLAMGGMR